MFVNQLCGRCSMDWFGKGVTCDCQIYWLGCMLIYMCNPQLPCHQWWLRTLQADSDDQKLAQKKIWQVNWFNHEERSLPFGAGRPKVRSMGLCWKRGAKRFTRMIWQVPFSSQDLVMQICHIFLHSSSHSCHHSASLLSRRYRQGLQFYPLEWLSVFPTNSSLIWIRSIAFTTDFTTQVLAW